MAIITNAELPIVLKLGDKQNNQLKKDALTRLGHPVVLVEVTEDMLESAIRTTGDFIAGYFPFEERYAFFMTEPLRSTYPLPQEAYWVKDVKWDPVTTRIDDIFGAESFLFNIGNITGIQNVLTDFHLLQAYRKFSQKVLGTEGQWEVKGDNQIRLYPTPRGSFPVVVEFLPPVEKFTRVESREIATRMLVSEIKIMLGNIRSKYGNIPSPDGGSLGLNGEALRTEGQKEKEDLVQAAILLTEPLGIYLQ